jgi:hypothetical protein
MLIEMGLEAPEREKKTFFELAERLAHTKDPSEQKRLKEDLARMTFGDSCRRSSGRTSRPR